MYPDHQDDYCQYLLFNVILQYSFYLPGDSYNVPGDSLPLISLPSESFCCWYCTWQRLATEGSSMIQLQCIYLATACRWDVSSIWQLHYTWRQLATKASSMWQLTLWQLSAEMFCIWQQYQVTAYHSYVFHVTALLHLATVCYWYVFHVKDSPCDSLPLSDVSCETLPGDSLPLRRLPCDSLAREWTAFWPVRLEWQRLGRDPNFGLPTRIE